MICSRSMARYLTNEDSQSNVNSDKKMQDAIWVNKHTDFSLLWQAQQKLSPNAQVLQIRAHPRRISLDIYLAFVLFSNK